MAALPSEGRCGLFTTGPNTTTPALVGNAYTLCELAAAVRRLTPLAHHAGRVWVLRQMDPAFREKIMLTVAQTNSCRYCSYVHQEWAIRAGVSDSEIAQLEGADPATFDRAEWSALVYARSLAEANFGPVPAEIAQEVAKYYTPRDRRNIEAVALVMSIANRSANTLEAFRSRLHGVPVSESLPAEIAITSALVALGPFLMPVLSIVFRKSPLRMLRELNASSVGISPSGA
jgi:AhpD family alkylhydroperoxidase